MPEIANLSVGIGADTAAFQTAIAGLQQSLAQVGVAVAGLGGPMAGLAATSGTAAAGASGLASAEAAAAAGASGLASAEAAAATGASGLATAEAGAAVATGGMATAVGGLRAAMGSLLTMMGPLIAAFSAIAALRMGVGLNADLETARMQFGVLLREEAQASFGFDTFTSTVARAGTAVKVTAGDTAKLSEQQRDLSEKIGFANRQLDIAQQRLAEYAKKGQLGSTTAQSLALSIDKQKASIAGMQGDLSAATAKLSDNASAVGTAAVSYETLSTKVPKVTDALLIDAKAAELAQERIQELYKFAETTPFEFPEVLAASRQLQRMGGSGLATGKVLTMVGDVAAGTGAPFSEIAMWVGRAYAAMQAGAPFGEATMRLSELGAIGPKAKKTLEDMTKSGASAATMWGVLTGEFNLYDGMMSKLSTTFPGRMSTLVDTVRSAAGALTESLFGVLSEGLQPLIDFIGGPVKGAFKDFSGILADGNVALGIVAVAAGALAAVIALVVAPALGGMIVAAAPFIAAAVGIAAAAAVIKTAWDTNFGGIRDLVAQVVAFIMPYVEVLRTTFADTWAEISELAGPAMTNIMDWLGAIGDFIVNVAAPMLDPLWQAFKGTFDAIANIVNIAFILVRSIIETVLAVIGGDFDRVGDIWQNAFKDIWNGLVNIVKGALTGMVGLIVAGVNAMIGVLNFFIDRVNDAIGALNTTFGRVMGWELPTIGNIGTIEMPDLFKKMEAGGIVTRPTLALLGERGPEAIVPLGGGGGIGGHLVVEVPVYLDRERIALAVWDSLKHRAGAGFALGLA